MWHCFWTIIWFSYTASDKHIRFMDCEHLILVKEVGKVLSLSSHLVMEARILHPWIVEIICKRLQVKGLWKVRSPFKIRKKVLDLSTWPSGKSATRVRIPHLWNQQLVVTSLYPMAAITTHLSVHWLVILNLATSILWSRSQWQIWTFESEPRRLHLILCLDRVTILEFQVFPLMSPLNF